MGEKRASVQANVDDIEKNLKTNLKDRGEMQHEEEIDLLPEMNGLSCISNSEKHKYGFILSWCLSFHALTLYNNI